MCTAQAGISRDRAVVYIDGFNLYFGLREARLDKYRWLNVQDLARKLIQSRQLAMTKYFTARISGPDMAKQKRQSVYLEALQTLPGLEIIYGKYLQHHKHCFTCGSVINSYSEKMTDVNIAVSLLTDAYTNQFDTAIVVSADSDLCPAIEAVRRLFPEKSVIVGFPPKRASQELRRVCSSYFSVGESTIRQSQLPPMLYKSDGTRLECPPRWV